MTLNPALDEAVAVPGFAAGKMLLGDASGPVASGAAIEAILSQVCIEKLGEVSAR